jgi:predicted nucleic acid-binding protein
MTCADDERGRYAEPPARRAPKDDILPDVALDGEAQCPITGNRNLLALDAGSRQSHGLDILNPADLRWFGLSGRFVLR